MADDKFDKLLQKADEAIRRNNHDYAISILDQILKMNPDRADVIIPASEIYSEVMRLFGADYVMVPGVGLKDGLLYALYEDLAQERIEDIQFLGQF